MKQQKRVIAIHDISGLGKCSLTVALPILSAAGIEVSVMPTAVFSAHTGIKGYTYRDLTCDMLPFAKHWKSLDIAADAVYTGFLGSYSQLSIVGDIIDMFKTKNNAIIIDPVMADEGRLYSIYDNNFPQGMKELVKKADIIIPNITEAALLTDTPYCKGPYSKKYIENLLKKLCFNGVKYVILTGVYFDEKKLGAAVFDCASGNTEYVFTERIAGYYNGTGDIFASSFAAAYLNGADIIRSAQIAANFTMQSIKRTLAEGCGTMYGVNFEQGICDLINIINKATNNR